MIWRKLLEIHMSWKIDNLLSVLEAAFASGVEEADQVAAAHVAHFIDAVVSKTFKELGKKSDERVASACIVVIFQTRTLIEIKGHRTIILTS